MQMNMSGNTRAGPPTQIRSEIHTVRLIGNLYGQNGPMCQVEQFSSDLVVQVAEPRYMSERKHQHVPVVVRVRVENHCPRRPDIYGLPCGLTIELGQHLTQHTNVCTIACKPPRSTSPTTRKRL